LPQALPLWAALAAAAASALAAAKFSNSIRQPSVGPDQWRTNVSKYVSARVQLEAETQSLKAKREEKSLKSLAIGQVEIYDLPTHEDSADCTWKIMREFDTRIARVQVLSKMILIGGKDRFEIRGLRSGTVVLPFGLFPNKQETDAFGTTVWNCIKKYTVEVRVFGRNMGLTPGATSPTNTNNIDKAGETQVEAHLEALKTTRQQLIVQEHRRRSFAAAHKKLDWLSVGTTSE